MVGCDREKTGQMLYDQPRAVIDGPGNRECASIPYLKSQGRMKTMRDPVRGFVSDRLMVQRKLDRCRLVVRRDSIACSIFPRVQRNPRMPLRLVISSFLFAFGLDALSLSRQAAAAQIPGESQTGILYAITHLHPIAYIILLLIFVLSVANLAYQGHLTRGRKALLLILRRGRFSEEADVPPPEPALRGVAQARPGTKTALPRSVSEEEERLQEGIVGPARAVRRPSASRGRQPTPLDGVNHTLPVLSPRGGNGVAVSEKVPDKSAAGPEFRFTSAVEVPPPDEIERRGREQLVVTGAVCGPDGRGLGAVIVYLVDDQGNRVGQSCRSLPETGEFKVHVNSPGRYVLHGYKRGFVEDSSEAPILPLESGKIEGYMLRMIPDGCVVHGKVVTDAASPAPAGMEVRCVCEGGAAGGIASTDSAGRFRIFGVSSDATCRIEVRNASGEVVFCSEPFETSGHREVHRELSFSVAAAHEDSGQGSAETAASSERDHEFPDPPVPPVTGPVS